MASRIRIRRGSTNQWNSSTKILDSGELGLDTTLNKLKAGNGSSLWSALPYINVLPSELTELAQDAVESAITAGTGITKNYNDTANTITLAVDSNIANKNYVDTAVAGLGSTAAITYIPVSQYGNADGVATLDENGKIPISELGNLIDGAPALLDTLNELAAAINDDVSYAATITTALGLKAPLASPNFTGTVMGIDKTMVGLANVDNTTDALKPVSTATQTALNLKLNLSEPSIDYYVSNSGTGQYLVNGILNGTIDFVKGKKYRIVVDAVGHPFWIQTSFGAYTLADVYSTGITNAGTDNGSILVELPQSAPDTLYYACEYHSTMKGTIDSRSIELLDYAPASAATSYTITSANSAKTTEFTAATDVTITIPSDPSNTTWPIGSSVEVRQMGAGRLIFSVTSPATIVSSDGYLKTRTQYSSAFLEKRAPNSWILTGDIDA